MSGTQRATTAFGAHTTAAEVVSGVDLSGRRAIVTGGASGIGMATARALASANAEVTLAVRDVEAGRRAAEDIMGSTGNKPVLIAPLTWPSRHRSRPSYGAGRDRCTSWSTTPASWPPH